MESKKKEEQLQLLHQNQKFFTSMTKVDQAIIANNEIPKVIPVNQQEIKKEVTMRMKEIKMISQLIRNIKYLLKRIKIKRIKKKKKLKTKTMSYYLLYQMNQMNKKKRRIFYLRNMKKFIV